VDETKIGKIDLVYTTGSNSLSVKTENIQILHINCRSLYSEECERIYGIDPKDNSNYYKFYFNERDHLKVNIDSKNLIKELSLIDIPIPTKVVVNGMTWRRGIEYFITDNLGLVLTHVPAGQSMVDIYFKSKSSSDPVAILKASKTIVAIDEAITFDASSSYDSDGTIVSYNLDFGDGTFYSSEKHTHKYSEPGTYGVILTVRDNDYYFDHEFINITVIDTDAIPELLGQVPDQLKAEDSPPWTLDLSSYKPKPLSNQINYYFYLIGENESLYSVIGENSSDDKLIFTPKSDAFGSDLTTLVLRSTEGLTSAQQLRINITPVNDPPKIKPLPDITMHYDEPYLFDFEPYVNDIDSLKSNLSLSIYDETDRDYIIFDGLTARFDYPQRWGGELLHATVKVSDGESYAKEPFAIYINDNYPPIIVFQLGNVTLYQGAIEHNVFDLDKYFMDPDGDEISFSCSKSNLDIQINLNNTVDISSISEWSGAELVTFRAKDINGAIKEQTVLITVIEVNDPPEIAPLPDLYIHYDHDYGFDLTPYVSDKDNTLDELSVFVSDHDHIRIDEKSNLGLILNYSKKYLNTSIGVSLTVFDGMNSTSANINVIITENFPPKLTSELPLVVFSEDKAIINAFDLDDHFNDVDDNIVNYSIFNYNFLNISLSEDNSVDFFAEQDWFGVEAVGFRATDSFGAFKEVLIDVNVLPVNDPPVILPIPTQYGEENQRWALDLSRYVVDVDNDFSELEFIVDDYNVVISGANLIFLGLPSTRHHIEVRVTDGEYSTGGIIEVEIRSKEDRQSSTPWDTLGNIFTIILFIELIVLVIAIIVQHKRGNFIVEEAFLICKGGLLISHQMRKSHANIDDEIFSGMFTAIQEFIHDSFAKSSESRNILGFKDDWILDELKLGNNKILIERSEHVYLAVIFSGKSSTRLRRIVTRLLNIIEKRYGDKLYHWDGNLRDVEGVDEILRVLIKSSDETDEKSEDKEKPDDHYPDTSKYPITEYIMDSEESNVTTDDFEIAEATDFDEDETSRRDSNNYAAQAGKGDSPDTPEQTLIDMDEFEKLYVRLKRPSITEKKSFIFSSKGNKTVLAKKVPKKDTNNNRIDYHSSDSRDQKDLRAPMAIKIESKRELPATYVVKSSSTPSLNEESTANKNKPLPALPPASIKDDRDVTGDKVIDSGKETAYLTPQKPSLKQHDKLKDKG
jgi:PKD repeat protein